VRTAILIVSTAVSRRDASDETGAVLAGLAEEAGGDLAGIEVVPDDAALIEDRLNHFIQLGCELILTCGGAGTAPEHMTPEATWAVVEREVPGVAEAMRAADRELLLLRGVSGLAGRTLIVNLPGPVEAARRAFGGVVAPLMPRD